MGKSSRSITAIVRATFDLIYHVATDCALAIYSFTLFSLALAEMIPISGGFRVVVIGVSLISGLVAVLHIPARLPASVETLDLSRRGTLAVRATTLVAGLLAIAFVGSQVMLVLVMPAVEILSRSAG